mmetsp:Transcript_43028/g.119000  ORF Transcript_43028/g.119000 Transcript_43028/m.119000 type:complete len:238 (+) Transcript_43028:408-1121(+)
MTSPLFPAGSAKTAERPSKLSSTKCDSLSRAAARPLPSSPATELQKTMFRRSTPVRSQKRHVSWSQCSVFRCIAPPGLTLVTTQTFSCPNSSTKRRIPSNAPGASRSRPQSTSMSLSAGLSLAITPLMSTPMRTGPSTAFTRCPPSAVFTPTGVTGKSTHTGRDSPLRQKMVSSSSISFMLMSAHRVLGCEGEEVWSPVGSSCISLWSAARCPAEVCAVLSGRAGPTDCIVTAAATN